MLARTTATARHPQTGPHPAGHSTTTTETKAAPTFELSVRQLLASVAAAVTAAILGSRLGVAGTLIGAALASSVTMVASAVYSHSLAAAQYRLKVARGHQDELDAPTTVIPVHQQAWGLVPVTQLQPTPTMATPAPAERRLPRWAVAGLGAIAACALALLTVTGIEAVRGTPLSGGDSGGLSVLGGNSAGIPDGAPAENDTPVPVDSSTSSTESAPAATDSSSTTVTSTTTVTATDPATDTSSSTSPSTSTTTSTSGSTAPPPSTTASTSTSVDTSADSAESSVTTTTATRVGGP